ncbi:hypothetical protein KL86PLE_41093 [uncultured Pleomorphomonas sp.]|uniref:Uncharacterized protein n=1 Tax=uncultured Pleomorphomonas sp. TaxID=442121 RepID=A0A212LIC4_9HYPH|nr:hypothetical protein KL86PLE_41093 [uncultured Pleomorphomonas sp.]
MIIGPTSLAKNSLGSQPVGMKSVVMIPQAINAPILGITMLLRKRPTCWTRTLRLEDEASPPPVAVYAILETPPRSPAMPKKETDSPENKRHRRRKSVASKKYRLPEWASQVVYLVSLSAPPSRPGIARIRRYENTAPNAYRRSDSSTLQSLFLRVLVRL